MVVIVVRGHAITQLPWFPLDPVDSASTRMSSTGSSAGTGDAMVKKASISDMM